MGGGGGVGVSGFPHMVWLPLVLGAAMSTAFFQTCHLICKDLLIFLSLLRENITSLHRVEHLGLDLTC